MKIATWNVNSIKARLPNVLEWLKEADPDVVLLQEIKCQAADFPALEIQSLGYQAHAVGQKSYNGVALLSKKPATDILEGLPGNEADEQARYVEATVAGVRIASIYLPNGNPVDSEKYPYKLGWMKRLKAQAEALLAGEQPVVLAGDYNVIPEPRDCYDPAAWAGDALFLPETRRHFREIVNLGYTDAFRAIHPQRVAYSFWDYQAGCWPKNRGLRIDHILLSPRAADRLQAVGIDKHVRAWEKPSDHVPVYVDLDIAPVS